MRISWKNALTVSASSLEPAIRCSRTLAPLDVKPHAASTGSRSCPGRMRSAMPSTNRLTMSSRQIAGGELLVVRPQPLADLRDRRPRQQQPPALVLEGILDVTHAQSAGQHLDRQVLQRLGVAFHVIADLGTERRVAARSLTRLMARMDGTRPTNGPKTAISFTVTPKQLPFRAEIRAASRRYRIPEPLIAAVIKCESNWNPRARSAKGARGLMQVLPRTARGTFGVRPARLWEPETKIDVGTAYLRRLAGRYRGDTADVIAAYNAGPTRVDRRSRLPRETRLYARCVRTWHGRYASVLG